MTETRKQRPCPVPWALLPLQPNGAAQAAAAAAAAAGQAQQLRYDLRTAQSLKVTKSEIKKILEKKGPPP